MFAPIGFKPLVTVWQNAKKVGQKFADEKMPADKIYEASNFEDANAFLQEHQEIYLESAALTMDRFLATDVTVLIVANSGALSVIDKRLIFPDPFDMRLDDYVDRRVEKFPFVHTDL